MAKRKTILFVFPLLIDQFYLLICEKVGASPPQYPDFEEEDE